MKRILIATTVLTCLAGAVGAWWWARGSLPPLDGQLTLPGLHGPVEVRFDRYGVPTAYATGTDDAWFVAGALHARDRLWQMELYRRVTNGRLSEVLGARTVPIDKRFLTLGLRQAADAEWQRLPPSTRLALERYAAGVNAVAAAEVGRLRPLEFQMLGITPAPWAPQDSLAVARLLAWRLAENHQAELVRAALTGRFGLESARLLTGRYPADGPTIVDTPAASRVEVAGEPHGRPAASGGVRPDRPAASVGAESWPAGLEWLAPGAKRGNSNNWVVAGSRTATGRPILANDPHLQIEFPSVWYEMHLVAADLDVAGVTVPGVPFVVLGHNQRVAWGMTNTGADVQDLYFERFDLAGRRANWRGDWSPVEVTAVEIPVRGQPAPLAFEVWRTPRGTVFAGADLDWDEPPSWLAPEGRPSGEQRAYTLRWDASGDLAAAVEALDRAGSWDAFTSAVGAFALSQNVVYADVDGNIGYAMSGRLPVRAGADGSRPAEGAEGDWTGTIDPAALPRVFNPAEGFIASANNEVDRGFAGLITRDWAAPFRAERLRRRLLEPGQVDIGAMEALQNDRRSLAADVLLAGAAAAIDTGRRAAAPAEAVSTLELLAAWDRQVDGRPVVTLYEAFEDALWRRTFVDEMGQPLFDRFYEWAGAERPAGVYAILPDRASAWWDDIATVEKRETRDDIFLLAAEDAGERLRTDWRSDASRQWDRVHAATFSHPLGAAWPLSWFLSRGPVPLAGDGTTVMRVSWNRLRPFAAWEHPSWRQIFDVGRWDQARVAMPAGQSGNPLSPHYFDQNGIWRAGQYRVQPFSRAAVTAAPAHTLLLPPN